MIALSAHEDSTVGDQSVWIPRCPLIPIAKGLRIHLLAIQHVDFICHTLPSFKNEWTFTQMRLKVCAPSLGISTGNVDFKLFQVITHQNTNLYNGRPWRLMFIDKGIKQQREVSRHISPRPDRRDRALKLPCWMGLLVFATGNRRCERAFLFQQCSKIQTSLPIISLTSTLRSNLPRCTCSHDAHFWCGALNRPKLLLYFNSGCEDFIRVVGDFCGIPIPFGNTTLSFHQ